MPVGAAAGAAAKALNVSKLADFLRRGRLDKRQIEAALGRNKGDTLASAFKRGAYAGRAGGPKSTLEARKYAARLGKEGKQGLPKLPKDAGFMRRGAYRSGEFFGASPISASLGAGLTGYAAYELVGEPVLGGLAGQFGVGFRGDLAREDMRLQQMLEQQRRAKEMARRSAENSVRLAALNPQLFQELAVGRQLPQQATVVGGRPRTDLLEEISMQMAMGGFDDAASGVAMQMG